MLAWTSTPLAAIASAWAWAPPPRVTVLELAVEHEPPEHVDALVVVVVRRHGPASAVADPITSTATAIRILHMLPSPWNHTAGVTSL